MKTLWKHPLRGRSRIFLFTGLQVPSDVFPFENLAGVVLNTITGKKQSDEKIRIEVNEVSMKPSC